MSRSAGDLNALAAANLALVLTSHVSDYFTVKVMLLVPICGLSRTFRNSFIHFDVTGLLQVDYEVGDAARIGARIIQGTQVPLFSNLFLLFLSLSQ